MAVLLLVALPSAATAASPEDVAVDVSHAVMSPFCPGVTLHDCPSAAADRLRLRIEEWARAGNGRAEILDRLEAEYGPSIRALPPASGAGLAAWLLPAAGLVLGIALAATLARRWAHKERAPVAPLTELERTRLDEELAAAGAPR